VLTRVSVQRTEAGDRILAPRADVHRVNESCFVRADADDFVRLEPIGLAWPVTPQSFPAAGQIDTIDSAENGLQIGMTAADGGMIQSQTTAFRASDQRERCVDDVDGRILVLGTGNRYTKNAGQPRAILIFGGGNLRHG
jgi:hypothetical protein